LKALLEHQLNSKKKALVPPQGLTNAFTFRTKGKHIV